MPVTTSQTKAVSIAALISCALFFSGLFTMLTPLPLLYASVAAGRRAGYLAAAAASSAAAAVYLFYLSGRPATETGFFGFLVPGQGFSGHLPQWLIVLGGIGYFVFFASIALSLAEGARREFGLLRWSGYTFSWGIGCLALVALAALYHGGFEVIEGLRSYVAFVLGELGGAQASAAVGADRLGFLADNAEEAARYFISLIPALVFSFVALTVALNMVVGRRLIRGIHAFAAVHNVARFRLPDWLIWFVIVSGAAFFADSYLLGAGWPRLAALNGIIGLGVLYFLQGMAVTVYFVQGIKAPLIRALAYIAMILFLQTVSLGLLAVGVADVWADFRLRRWRALHHHNNK